MSLKDHKKLILSTALLIAFFVAAEFLARHYSEVIAASVAGHEISSAILFVLMAALAVIIPVWSNLFLIPFGVVILGSFMTALLCIAGWWVGSVISFAIGRSYKELLLKKYPSLSTHTLIDSIISKKYPFLSLVFLRVTLPVDVLSYALGLFSKRISWKENAVSTLIGITPFAFIFSYINNLSLNYQVSITVLTVTLFILYVVIMKKIKTTV